MTQAATPTTNIASNGAVVGIQAEEVHNSPVYQVFHDAPPSEKYQIGVRYLDDGVPSRARELIGQAIARGHDSGEVRFHWVLAMLSKRAYRDLTPPEREQLDCVADLLCNYRDDEWKRALSAICDLLRRLKEARGDPGGAVTELLALPQLQRDKVVRHLDLVLTGGMKDSVWAETRRAAEEGRFAEDRLNRVWAYFHPRPAGARARQPEPDSTTSSDRVRAIGSSILFVAAVAHLGWLLLQQTAVLPVLSYLLAIVAGFVASRTALEWHYRNARLRAKDDLCFSSTWIDRNFDDGFANRVSQSFRYYFAKYVPKNTTREQWLTETRGVQAALRNEVVEL
ncbi:hypothetical protein GCM10023108_22450 [Saccharopolyspora hordei]